MGIAGAGGTDISMTSQTYLRTTGRSAVETYLLVWGIEQRYIVACLAVSIKFLNGVFGIESCSSVNLKQTSVKELVTGAI